MLRIGHRGASAEAPENTIASFRRAVDLGADAVELDLHRTREGRFIVIHDDTLDRTTGGHGPVDALTFDELRRLDAGSWKDPAFAGERLPTLEEVVDALPARVAVLRDLLGRVRVSSFDHRALARLRQLLPAVSTGALFVALPVDPVAIARACGAQAIHPNFRYLTRDVVDEAHRAGLAVHAWTVNEPADIVAVRGLGVDGIMSDHPERL